jgi:hypothetical protein
MTDKQKKDGKAFETFNIEIDVTCLNPKYTLSKQTANVRTGNGLLKVFQLNPSGGGPSFIGNSNTLRDLTEIAPLRRGLKIMAS